MRANVGMDLDDFFQQWIHGEYSPKYGVSWELSESNDLILTIEQTQDWQYFHMPIELMVIVRRHIEFQIR